MKGLLIVLQLILIVSSVFSGIDCMSDTGSPKDKAEVHMKITSSAIAEGDAIPVKFTCDGADYSPRLEISDIPKNAKSLALICDDPDAPVGDWVHWVLFNIPPEVGVLPENLNKSPEAKTKVKDREVSIFQGKNDFGKFGYNGPCPPRGSAHRYYFKVYALDTDLKFDDSQLQKGITKAMLLEKIKGHVLGEASLMGKYKRK